MFSDAIELGVAVLGLGMVIFAIRQGRAKGAAAALQMAASGFLLLGAAAVGVVEFFVGLVFSPLAWVGVGMLALAGVLFVTGQKLEGRSSTKGDVRESAPKGKLAESGKRREKGASAGDEFDDIEAILRKHGIE